MVDKQRNQHYPLVPISIILSALKEDPISIKMIDILTVGIVAHA